jgi:hypothetical protein
MFLKFEHSDLAISKVSHYGFLRGHSSIRGPSHLNAIQELGPSRNTVQVLRKCHVTSVGLGA